MQQTPKRAKVPGSGRKKGTPNKPKNRAIYIISANYDEVINFINGRPVFKANKEI